MKQMHQQSDMSGFGDLVHLYLGPSQSTISTVNDYFIMGEHL